MKARNTWISSVVILFAAASISAAQPPPLGPPVNRSDAGVEGKTALSMGTTIKNTIRDKIRSAVTDPRVSLKSIDKHVHFRTFTSMRNRPNSHFVRMFFNVDFEISNPSFNRHVFLPIDVDVFCDDWYTTHGRIVLRVTPGPPSIEGGNTIEDVITIRDDIDAAIKNAFVAPLPVTENLPLNCSTIGANAFEVLWDLPIVKRRTDDVRAKPTIVVTFDRLKRLAARTRGGSILYRETEDIILNTFANYAQAQKVLTMREGDESALSLPAVQLDARGLDNLVIIGSVEQPPGNPLDMHLRPPPKRKVMRRERTCYRSQSGIRCRLIASVRSRDSSAYLRMSSRIPCDF